MPADSALRIADAVQRTSEPRRRALRAHLGSGDLSDEDLAALLADADRIERTIAALPDDVADDLAFLADAAHPHDPGPHGADPIEALCAQGLLFEIGTGEERVFTVPFEVLATLPDTRLADRAPLVAWLAWLEDDELRTLARTHTDLPSTRDHADLARQVAKARLEGARIDALLEPLGSAAIGVLRRLVERPPAQRRRAEVRGPNGAPERTLVRLGLVFEHPADPDLLVVPPDLEIRIDAALDARMGVELRSAWTALRDRCQPAQPDLWPRGAGGNALVAFRYRLLRALQSAPDPAHPVDRLLALLGILDAETNDLGALASVHLDAAGSEAMARVAIRTWLNSIDDELTRPVAAAWGADPAAVADWLLAPERVPDERDPRDDGWRWTQFLFAIRAELIFVISLLPPVQWIPLDALATFHVRIVDRIAFRQGLAEHFSGDFPRAALPVHPLDCDPDRVLDATTDALRRVLAELLEPIGAVAIAPAGDRFAVNPSALRVFANDDSFLDEIWGDIEPVVEADLDYWYPLPTDPGVRVAGLAAPVWRDGETIEIAADAHLWDLVRLAQFATVSLDVDAFRFRFEPRSVGVSRAFGADAEEFASWLVVRTGQALPRTLRGMLGLRGPRAADSARDAAYSWARDHLLALLDRDEAPALGVVEELRGWGEIAANLLVAELDAASGAREWDRPGLPFVCHLLGELGEARALPSLLRCVAFTDSVPLESAAAMAAARIGPAAIEGLTALVANDGAEFDKRVAAASALSTIAILYPERCGAVAGTLTHVLEIGDLEPDVATLIALYLADTGHPSAERALERLQERGAWAPEISDFEDAVDIARTSPGVFGHPVWALGSAQIHGPVPMPIDDDDLEDETDGDDDLDDPFFDAPPSERDETRHRPRRRRGSSRG
jgi:hypothetical protein